MSIKCGYVCFSCGVIFLPVRNCGRCYLYPHLPDLPAVRQALRCFLIIGRQEAIALLYIPLPIQIPLSFSPLSKRGDRGISLSHFIIFIYPFFILACLYVFNPFSIIYVPFNRFFNTIVK